mmetsp:Transcript_30914/g.91799  ORF Transcript_30914/g.91799 Transcript_30914/m.91799 type:complete len:205 (+) Transcript_30914:164-778(+)
MDRAGIPERRQGCARSPRLQEERVAADPERLLRGEGQARRGLRRPRPRLRPGRQLEGPQQHGPAVHQHDGHVPRQHHGAGGDLLHADGLQRERRDQHGLRRALRRCRDAGDLPRAVDGCGRGADPGGALLPARSLGGLAQVGGPGHSDLSPGSPAVSRGVQCAGPRTLANASAPRLLSQGRVGRGSLSCKADWWPCKRPPAAEL